MTLIAHRSATIVAMLMVLTLGLSSCGNTIRGIGNDLGNAVDATRDAGRSVANSVR
ncbi:MAG: entericidin B signal peptide protein [Rhizobium sp.]|nr:entericidin B signal peptide protein [Rhizobium sp.]MCZ8352695.1 entericidin B signal peptide protein [Rhizobium sp.]